MKTVKTKLIPKSRNRKTSSRNAVETAIDMSKGNHDSTWEKSSSHRGVRISRWDETIHSSRKSKGKSKVSPQTGKARFSNL